MDIGNHNHESIQTFLTQIRPSITDVVTGTTHAPTFTPNTTHLGEEVPARFLDFVRQQNFPALKGFASTPSLLLHDLEEGARDKTRSIRRSNYFKARHNSLIYNASGSGKTRSMLEGLANDWGFYFLCRLEGPLTSGVTRLGSRDLPQAIFTEVEKHEALTTDLRQYDNTTMARRLEVNQTIAREAFLRVLLARLLIFREFLETVPSELTGEDEAVYIRRWLELQLHPWLVSSSSGDIFLDLTQKLKGIHPSIDDLAKDVHSMASLVLPKVSRDPDGGDFFLVLDEAQDAASCLPFAFSSSSGGLEPRPVLREIVFGWALALQGLTNLEAVSHRLGEAHSRSLPFTFVAAGTGISDQDLTEAVSSSTMKGAPFRRYTNVGGFDTEVDHLTYISRYVPSELLATHDGKVLLRRLRYWMHGRFRFTAEYLTLLISHCYLNPHQLLNRYIARFTGFYPLDITPRDLSYDWENPKGFVQGYEPDIAYTSLPFERTMQNDEARHTITIVAYRYFIKGELRPGLGSSQVQFLQDGFARIVLSRDGGMTYEEYTIDEVLVLHAATVWLNNRGDQMRYKHLSRPTLYETLANALPSHDPTSGGANSFEDFLVHHFARIFTTPRPMSEALQFYGVDNDEILWSFSHRRARIVALGKSGDDSVAPYEVGTVRITADGTIEGISGCLGLSSGEDGGIGLWNWLERSTRVPFFYPPKAMGPDIVFVLELEAISPTESPTYVWVAVQAKFQQGRSFQKTGKKLVLTKADLQHAVASTSPNRWFLHKSDPITFDGTQSTGNIPCRYEKRDHTLSLLEELPNPDPSPALGSHKLIRVIASFPALASFEDFPDFVDPETGLARHPIARLNTDLLKQSTATMHPTNKLANYERDIRKAYNLNTSLRNKSTIVVKNYTYRQTAKHSNLLRTTKFHKQIAVKRTSHTTQTSTAALQEEEDLSEEGEPMDTGE
ncbi:hypothetical protein PM082_022921 [Marasmius tenuissimus]|nr:hypothetical protein PM082_022921 [Marasmius tenuissimus]